MMSMVQGVKGLLGRLAEAERRVSPCQFECLEPRLMLAAADAFEPGDNVAAGATAFVGVDAVQNHSIHVAGDVDWASFTLGETSDVRIYIDGFSSTDDLEMWLYGPNDPTDEIAYNDNGSFNFYPKIERTGLFALGPGEYHVKVQEKGNDAEVNLYLLRFNTMPSGNAAPTINMAEPLLPTTIPQGATVQIAWSDSDPDDDAVINLAYDPDTDATPWTGSADHTFINGPISENDTNDFYNWDTSDVAPGTYTVWSMISDGHWMHDDVYGRAAGLVTILAPDSYEDDDTPDDATEIATNGDDQLHNIHTAGDVDWVKFTLAGRSSVTILTAGTAGDTEIWLYGPGSAAIQVAYDDDGGAGTFSRIDRTGGGVLAPGEYFVKIQEYGSNDAIEDYTVLVLATLESPGWHFTGVGDFNNDGTDDVASRDIFGNWYVGLSTGAGFVAKAKWGRWTPSATWTDAHVGDFNADGKADILGRDDVGRWVVGLSDGTGFTKSIWDRWSTAITWSNSLVGDFNGDGRDDIAARDGNLGRWVVGLSTGTRFVKSVWTRWSTALDFSDVAVGDFDDDGNDDIAGRDNANRWFVSLATGSESFTRAVWGRWSSATAWRDVCVGDFNGDGRDDIAGRRADDGRWLVGKSNGSGYASGYWGSWGTARTWRGVGMGHFNADDPDDLFGIDENGRWRVGLAQPTDRFTSTTWGQWLPHVTWCDIHVGDFDGNGLVDILARDNWEQWNVGLSTGSAFDDSIWGNWS